MLDYESLNMLISFCCAATFLLIVVLAIAVFVLFSVLVDFEYRFKQRRARKEHCDIEKRDSCGCKYLYNGLALDYEHFTACMLKDIKESIKGGVDNES